MKYFLQFEGREKLLLKVIVVMQIIIIIFLFWLCIRPNYLYIGDEQLKEALIWLENESNLEEHPQIEKVKVEEQLDCVERKGKNRRIKCQL